MLETDKMKGKEMKKKFSKVYAAVKTDWNWMEEIKLW